MSNPITSVTNIAGSATMTTLTVIGLNFVPVSTTPSLRLADVACYTTGWVSTTSATCIAPMKDPLSVTVGGVVGTMTISFTYDGPPRCPFDRCRTAS